MAKFNYKRRIVVDPEIMAGKPVIAGTRIPVELVLKKLSQGIDVKEVLEDYPRLTKDDVRAAILYALEAIEGEEVYPSAGR